VLINVSENAFQAHLDHGDASPGDLVTGTDYMFGANCEMLELTYVETVQVNPDGTDYSSSVQPLGVNYELRTDDTYNYGPGLADALCSDRPGGGGWVNGDDYTGPYASWLQVFVDGVPFNWSPHTCQVITHAYTGQITGDGTPIVFSILDDNYGDNTGFIEVEIWAWS
jgi:hypothetical protein